MSELKESGAADGNHGSADGLGSWLISGLVLGAIVLGLVVAAFAVGYHRGQDHARQVAQAPSSTASKSTASKSTPATSSSTAGSRTPQTQPTGPLKVTPALVAQGKQLYASDGCSACHTISGAPATGPTFKGLHTSTVTLDNGQTAVADEAYLRSSIVDPDAQIVKGFHAGVMGPVIQSFNLGSKPADVNALVAYIESLK